MPCRLFILITDLKHLSAVHVRGGLKEKTTARSNGQGWKENERHIQGCENTGEKWEKIWLKNERNEKVETLEETYLWDCWQFFKTNPDLKMLRWRTRSVSQPLQTFMTDELVITFMTMSLLISFPKSAVSNKKPCNWKLKLNPGPIWKCCTVARLSPL